ncbi:MAG: HAD family hydrolase [bacterium]|nr:HAD family hydrolase [bacterium]
MVRFVVFDFFGTLVSYAPNWTGEGFQRSHELLREAGADLGYQAFLETWDRTAQAFEERAALHLAEYSMEELTSAFLAQCPGLRVNGQDAGLVDAFVATYVEEWSLAVTEIPGVDAMLARLRGDYTLAVLSNTNTEELVPSLLERVGIAHCFIEVVTSIELGVRKPGIAAFEAALGKLGATASESVYIGDNFEADYRGARRAGMSAFFVGSRDGRSQTQLPEHDRLDSVLNLERHLPHLVSRISGQNL